MTERFALVTGAGSGVGRAAALALLGAGWSVALAGRRESALAETIAASRSVGSQSSGPGGGKAVAIAADVTDPESVASLFARIGTTFGRLDVLFNNAGGGLAATNFGDVTFAQWRQVVAVNLDGMFLVASGAFRMMRDQSPRGGRIINNGSISAHAPRPGSAPYTATKHAVTGLTKSIALDGRAFDIACGQIDIGNAATPMTERMTQGVPQADGRIAVEPRMDAADIGRAILFMADLPPEAHVQTITVMATKMPFVGRG